MGTPVYMAPELILGSKYAQPSADVFSLGVLAFEMFTGRRSRESSTRCPPTRRRARR